MTALVPPPCLDKAARAILNSVEIYYALDELRRLDPDKSFFGFRLENYAESQSISVEIYAATRYRGPVPTHERHDTIEAALVWQHKQLLEIIAEIEAA